jgi:hypothetical protein
MQVSLLPMAGADRWSPVRTDDAQACCDRKELAVDAKPAKVSPSFDLHAGQDKSRVGKKRQENEETMAVFPHFGFLERTITEERLPREDRRWGF